MNILRSRWPFVCLVCCVGFLLAATPALAAVTNWQKGASVVPDPDHDYFSTSFQQSLAELRATNANYVSLIIPLYQSSVSSNSIAPGWDTPSDEALAHAITLAHSLGLKVNVKLHPEVPGRWRADIDPTDRTKWFQSYGSLLKRYADLAEANKVEQLTIGTELIKLAAHDHHPDNTAAWEQLIADVRGRYSGSLTYAANWGSGWADEKNRIEFWDKLDVAGIDAYYPLGNDYYNSSVDYLKNQWDTWERTDIKPFYDRINKPILFTEVGYRSTTGAHTKPWDYSYEDGVNHTLQANAYEALLSYWDGKSYVQGVHLWDWDANPNAGGYSSSFTPQNKPAEKVMEKWFGKSTLPVTPGQFSFVAEVDASGATVLPNRKHALVTRITNTGDFASGLTVRVEVFSDQGTRVHEKTFSNESIASGYAKGYATDWTPTQNGSYRVAVSVQNGNTTYLSRPNAYTVTVSQDTPTTVAFTGAVTVNPNPLPVNQDLTITPSVTNTKNPVSGIIIDVEVFNQSGNRVHQQLFEGQSFGANETKRFPFTWKVPTTGTYAVKLGIFSSGWVQNYLWLDNAATVTATNQTGDITPPSVPGGVVGTSTGPSTIALSWQAATDNVGVTGYSVLRNGTVVGTTTARNFTDTNLTPNTVYRYAILARDAAGNQSAPSSEVTVRTKPAVTGCPSTAPKNAFTACYFNHPDFTNFALTRDEAKVDHNWGNSSPHASIEVDTFSAVWTGTHTFEAGEYAFTAITDDGIRVYIDNILVLDKWIDQDATYEFWRTLSAGDHTVKVEYFESYGGARASVSWKKSQGNSDTTPPTLRAGAPSGTLAAGTNAVTISAQTNEVASCKYSTTPNRSYGEMEGTLQAGANNAHTTYVTGLQNSRSYNYYVRCRDQAGNTNGSDYRISFSVGSQSTGVVDVWWPTAGSPVSGTVPFKAILRDRELGTYHMHWQVDGDRLNPMYDSQEDYPHKEAWVDVRGWTWKGKGPYRLNFIAKDMAGNTLGEKSIDMKVE